MNVINSSNIVDPSIPHTPVVRENRKESFIEKHPKTVIAIGAISGGIFGGLAIGSAALLTIGALPVTIGVVTGLAASATVILTVIIAKRILSKPELKYIAFRYTKDGLNVIDHYDANGKLKCKTINNTKSGVVEVYDYSEEGELDDGSGGPKHSLPMRIAKSIYRGYRDMKEVYDYSEEGELDDGSGGPKHSLPMRIAKSIYRGYRDMKSEKKISPNSNEQEGVKVNKPPKRKVKKVQLEDVDDGIFTDEDGFSIVSID